MKFLKHGFSLDEFKTSALVMMFVLFSIVSIFMYITTGDISDNWLNILTTLVYVIGGVNAVKGITTIVENREDKTNKIVEQVAQNVVENVSNNIAENVAENITDKVVDNMSDVIDLGKNDKQGRDF